MTLAATIPAARTADAKALLSLEGVSVALYAQDRPMVTDVTFAIRPREVFGIVGESGSGKTMLTRTIFGLHDDAYVAAGRVTFDGTALDLRTYRAQVHRLLGRRIGFVPQDPFSSLNPTMRVGRQITEALYLAKGYPINSAKCRDIAIGLLDEVGIGQPELAFNQFPDQFSGGMRQRIVIAIALSQEPALLIADEPTTALDAITQRKIIDLILERGRSRDLAVVLISHNLELLRQNVDRIAVLYGGQLLNLIGAADLGARPAHPYTEALFDCLPRKDKQLADIRSIPGEPVGAGFGTIGCAFASRCRHAEETCRTGQARQNAAVDDAFSACLLGLGA